MSGAIGVVSTFYFGVITSDDWGSYGREVPKETLLKGRNFTPQFETVIKIV